MLSYPYNTHTCIKRVLISDLDPPVDVAETITSLFSSASQVLCTVLFCATPEESGGLELLSFMCVCVAVINMTVYAHTSACVLF